MKATGPWIDAPATQAVCARLEDAGHQALLVGGCVRNALLSVEVNDIDIATDAHPDQVIALCEAVGRKVVPTGIEHGTVTVVEDSVPFEITTFRKDVETDGRRATVVFANNTEDDARRRDFTMNALYARRDGEIIDPLGGLPDLKARCIRFIDDAEQRIREDYLRILRFFRFFAHFGDHAQGIDAEGLAACAALADRIDGLSRERVVAEMLNLLSAPDPSLAVASMEQSGVLQRAVPGASQAALAPLVHIEANLGLAPDPLRRLASLGFKDLEAALRLSKKQMKQVLSLRERALSSNSPEELGYNSEVGVAISALALRAALLEQPIDPDAKDKITLGAQAVFPIKAVDLMPKLEGKALGDALAMLERDWIASGFSLSRAELLAKIP